MNEINICMALSELINGRAILKIKIHKSEKSIVMPTTTDAEKLSEFIHDIIDTMKSNSLPPSEIALICDDGYDKDPQVIVDFGDETNTYTDGDGDKWAIRQAYDLTKWALEKIQELFWNTDDPKITII